MIFSEEKLRLIDSCTLAEAEPLADRGRPLEWRRSLNFFRFDAKDFIVDYTYWINKSEDTSDLSGDAGIDKGKLVPLIESDIKQQISVSAKVSFDDIRDNFYKISEIDKEEKIFSLSRSGRAKNLIVTIKDGNPISEDGGVFKAGSYYGLAAIDHDHNNDLALFLEFTANSEAIIDLVNHINSGILEKVLFSVVILSFSDEVDDAVRHWSDSRDFLIHGVCAQAALETMVIRKKESSQLQNLRATCPDDAQVDADSPDCNQLETEENSPRNVSISNRLPITEAAPDASTLKSIKHAIWALVVILFLNLFK
ncbi:MAG: hypothetical protein RLY86_3897 [Pseudomonadota bacterium]|jgi:hypothetical protein